METQTTPGATLPNTLPVQTPPAQATQASTASSQPFGSIQQASPVTTGIHTSNLIPTASPIIIPITVPSPSTLQNSGTDVHQNMTDMQKIQASMEDQQKKIDAMYTTLEKIRKHNVVTMWLTIIFVVLPIVLSVFALPYLMRSYAGALGGGDTASPLDISSILKQVQNAKAGQVTPEQPTQ